VTDVLSQRGLNRATLARQYLLERAPARAIEAVERLGGMQSQAPLAPYVALWTRLQDFAQDELSALTEERQVVRLHLMRNTVHLVSVRDCLDWRALFYPLHAAEFGAHFRRGTEGVDRDALLRQAKRLLESSREPAASSASCSRNAGRTPIRARWPTRRRITSRCARCHHGASGARTVLRHGHR
jgi:Winged helix DNA-binding domain